MSTFAFKGRYAGDGTPENQRVNIVRTYNTPY